MKNITVIIGMILFSLTLISAIYAGESKTFDFGYEIRNCSIINSTYNLDGLTLLWNNTNVTISTVVNYKPDNLTISCWINKEGIEEQVSVGGSSSDSKTGTKNYNAGTLVWPYSKGLKKWDTIRFKLSEYHTLTLTFINKDFVLMEIESDVIYVDLKEGEEKNISVEGRGYNDLSIKLNSIEKNRAYITLTRIFELVYVETEEDKVREDFMEIELDDTTKEDIIIDITNKSDKYKRYIYIAIFAVILVGFYFLANKYLSNEETEESEANLPVE